MEPVAGAGWRSQRLLRRCDRPDRASGNGPNQLPGRGGGFLTQVGLIEGSSGASILL